MTDDRVSRLERQVRLLRFHAAGLTFLALGAVATGFSGVQRSEVLRVRGIVIEDEQGRERILIGAPVPAAARRVRTDSARVRSLWARRYPNPSRYLEFYRGYRHDMNGILVLDSAGFDRVAIGDPVPDPNIGRRIAPSTGLVINDRLGFERSGYGMLTVNGKDRVVIGLDNASGEALSLFVDDAGQVGIAAQDSGRVLWIGSARQAMPGLGLTDPLFGIALSEGGRVRHRITLDSTSR